MMSFFVMNGDSLHLRSGGEWDSAIGICGLEDVIQRDDDADFEPEVRISSDECAWHL